MAALINVDQIKILKSLMSQLDYAYLVYKYHCLRIMGGEELTYSHDSCDEYEFFEHIDFKGKDIGGIGKLNNSLIDSKSKTQFLLLRYL